jgi:MFS family permease
VLSFLRLPKPEEIEADFPPRPTRAIIVQPRFIVALLCGMLGYGVMSFLMTATPLAMNHHNHDFSDTAFVIQWHILGMFAPSLVTGHLIRYFGVSQVMLVGALLGLGCIFINLSGTELWHFWTALLLLGISWNFLFVGATTLLTETYHQSERTKAQAINDFSVFSTVAIASLIAGALQHQFGWRIVNIGAIPALIIIILAIHLAHHSQTTKTD